MDNIARMTSVLQELTNRGLLVGTAERIELKRTKSGHFRLYIPQVAGVPQRLHEDVYAIAVMHDTTCNPFAKAGRLVSVQFVDNHEDTNEQQ